LILSGDIYGENEQASDIVDSNAAVETAAFISVKELSTVLQTEIEKLPPVFGTLITLFHIEELSYEEIMQITGMPEGTVKNYLFRARKALKNGLLANYKKEDLC
jgi:RNA polymerase sigma-70 factor (ECF subfamily)